MVSKMTTMTTRHVVLLLLAFGVVDAQPSRRAQCAIECYSKCMLAGTPNAVYCNCPVAKSARVCSGATEEFLQRKIASEDLSATTEYLSAHSIRISTTSLPKTFMNVFEYTEVENLDKPNMKWTFAGASSGHDLTFSVSDPCKGYAYRVVSILRTADAENYLTAYRPRVIPIALPSFSVDPELIKLDEPEFGQSVETITVTAIWMNPGGYLDTDIAGVEEPSAYPIHCQTPEGELPDPKVELFYNGGRISVELPSDVLTERCRFLFQVKVLPKCGRLEPFNVQANIEVNCENFPSHPVCSRERAPQCTNIVDVWGTSKNATVMWKLKDQSDKPLYYHVRHGAVEKKGAGPFVSWKIVKPKEEKVRAEINSLELEVKSDEDYGVQVCAVYSKLYRVPKFDLVSVTPFVCTPCSVSDTVTGEWFQKCDECSKIEEKAPKASSTPIKVISMEAPLLSVEEKVLPSTKLLPVMETKTTSAIVTTKTTTPVPTPSTVAPTTTAPSSEETMPPTSIDLEEEDNDLSVSEALLFPPIASRATEEGSSDYYYDL
uniref:Ig-like domain-containing protein n=1 Tax=Steinernema glaseri TaxID=37863 RepID=A0A1I7Z289_9BILA